MRDYSNLLADKIIVYLAAHFRENKEKKIKELEYRLKKWNIDSIFFDYWSDWSLLSKFDDRKE